MTTPSCIHVLSQILNSYPLRAQRIGPLAANGGNRGGIKLRTCHVAEFGRPVVLHLTIVLTCSVARGRTQHHCHGRPTKIVDYNRKFTLCGTFYLHPIHARMC